jgi:hypothetical protein
VIRYEASEEKLRELIEDKCPEWLTRAHKRSEKFIAAGQYQEAASIWSEVKPVYMQIQFDKCIYCERQLASPELGGTIEHDVEHFRPKNGVEVWPTAAMQESRGSAFDMPLGHAYPSGYYWLAYEIRNYAAACKKCNTPLKLNFSPSPAGGDPGRPICLHSTMKSRT